MYGDAHDFDLTADGSLVIEIPYEDTDEILPIVLRTVENSPDSDYLLLFSKKQGEIVIKLLDLNRFATGLVHLARGMG